MKIVYKYRDAFKRQVISTYLKGENAVDLHKTNTFKVRTHLWIAYVLFNVGLFLPIFIFKISDVVKVQLNLEVAVLFALWAIFAGRWGKRALRWFTVGFGLFYVVALVYNSYAGALSGLYQKEANFFNDYSFVIGGMSFLLEALNLPLWVYLAGSAGLIFLIVLIFWGARTTFEDVSIPDLGSATRFGLITLGVIAILAGGIFPKLIADLQIPLSSVTAEMAENIQRSFESRENLKTFETLDPTFSYDYEPYPLSRDSGCLFHFH